MANLLLLLALSNMSDQEEGDIEYSCWDLLYCLCCPLSFLMLSSFRIWGFRIVASGAAKDKIKWLGCNVFTDIENNLLLRYLFRKVYAVMGGSPSERYRVR